jgi:hypothetical protein
MKKLTVIFTLITLIITLGFLSQTIFLPEAKAAAAVPQPVSCPYANCQELEAAILSATVRVHLQVWRILPDESGYDLDESIGHATLRDGRYLVTHNHYALLEHAGMPDTAISVALYDHTGRYLFSSPLTDYRISQAGAETLVLEMKNDFHRDQLAAAITSASFAGYRSLKLRQGTAVAQVDWDGRVSRVDWTAVEEVITRDGLPRLLLSDGITGGGSGGGVFWNGVHIANNWQSHERLDAQGNILFATSLAPLNDF